MRSLTPLLLSLSYAITHGSPLAPREFLGLQPGDDYNLQLVMGSWFEGIISRRPEPSDGCIVRRYSNLHNRRGDHPGYDWVFTETLVDTYSSSRFIKFREIVLEPKSPRMPPQNETDSFVVYDVGPAGVGPTGQPQYDYFVLSNDLKYPVTVLARNHTQFRANYQEAVLYWLEKEGFIDEFTKRFNLIRPYYYQGCNRLDDVI